MEKKQSAALVSQQFRLRDISKITGYRIGLQSATENEREEKEDIALPCQYHYTVHKNADPIPLFTSVQCPAVRPPIPPTRHNGNTVQWPELKKDFEQVSARQSVVVRLWATIADGEKSEKLLLACYGMHFSGLVPYSELLSDRLRANSLVIRCRNGFSYVLPESIQWKRPADVPAKDRVQGQGKAAEEEKANGEQQKGGEEQDEEEDEDKEECCVWKEELFRKYQSIQVHSMSLHSCCSLDQLLSLQKRQLRLKYKREQLHSLRMEIQSRSGACMTEENLRLPPATAHYYRQTHSHGHNHHSAGTMGKTLTRLLNMETERVDPKTLVEAFKLRRRIEAVQVRCRLLALERDRAQEHVHALERERAINCDKNVEADSRIMANYHGMSKEKENYLHQKLTLTKNLETLTGYMEDWRMRRQTLLREISEIYDVKEHEGGFYTINGISLPDAEALETSHVPPTSISVALGYVAHLVLVASNVLGVPLRNPIQFRGSQSRIIGQQQILNTNEFPLFCRTMPPAQETKYAIYLLNQDLAQLLVHTGQWPKDLRMTLANMMKLTKDVNLVDGDQISLCPFIHGVASVSDLEEQCREKGPGKSLDGRKLSWAEEVNHSGSQR